MGLFDKLRGKLSGVFSHEGKVDDAFYDELEESLIASDVGASASADIVERLRAVCRKNGYKTHDQAREALRELLADILDSAGDRALHLSTSPSIILVIGVNGVGKTTTIGKLAKLLANRRKRVLLCAGDTFRAAAADQLEIWANRAGVELVRQHEGADPASVVFDAINAAKARGVDVIICDTAGRLHNKQNLMNELNKISRVIDRELPGAHRENLLVLDATTGQNGLLQVRSFAQAVGTTGLVLTKLDGSAKGGIVIAVAETLKIPVKFIGLGEQIGDLREFDPSVFVEELV